jgi:hypothetical protein
MPKIKFRIRRVKYGQYPTAHGNRLAIYNILGAARSRVAKPDPRGSSTVIARSPCDEAIHRTSSCWFHARRVTQDGSGEDAVMIRTSKSLT